MNEALRKGGLRLLGIITDAEGAKHADALFHKTKLPIQYRFRAEGTAPDDMLDYLGLADTEKVVLLCMVPGMFAPRLLAAVSDELSLRRPGHGVAFTLPVSGASNPLARMMDEQARQALHEKMESEVDHMKESAAYSLALAVVNQGYSEEVMDAARQAGANGGTIIHARRSGIEEAMHFWGISLQQEKEIVAILCSKENKVALMKAIGEKCGMRSEAQGLVLSLPVDSFAGLQGEDDLLFPKEGVPE